MTTLSFDPLVPCPRLQNESLLAHQEERLRGRLSRAARHGLYSPIFPPPYVDAAAMTSRADDPLPDTAPVALPYVFECRQCRKVFEARTSRAFCPECDSDDVERLTT